MRDSQMSSMCLWRNSIETQRIAQFSYRSKRFIKVIDTKKKHLKPKGFWFLSLCRITYCIHCEMCEKLCSVSAEYSLLFQLKHVRNHAVFISCTFEFLLPLYFGQRKKIDRFYLWKLCRVYGVVSKLQLSAKKNEVERKIEEKFFLLHFF